MQYHWQEGSNDIEGYENIGEYLVFIDQNTQENKTNTQVTIFDQLDYFYQIDMSSDRGKKLAMLVAEGGFVPNKTYGIDKTGRGVSAKGGGQRETLFGLLLISASMDNRLLAIHNSENDNLNLKKFWGDGSNYESLFKPSAIYFNW